MNRIHRRNELTRFKKPKSKQAWVVFICFSFILLGYVLAIFWLFAFPQLLIWVFPNGVPEEKKIVVTTILGIFTAAVAVWFPGVSLKSLVESAIEDAAAAEINHYREEFEKYKRENSSDYIIKRLKQEFNALLIEVRNILLDHPDISVNVTLHKRKVRETLKKQLFDNEDLVRKIALEATKAVFSSKAHLSGKEAVEDYELQLFWQDMYMYIKAWLMFSIENEYLMEVEEIEQQLPNEKKRYIEALYNIKERQIREEYIVQKLDQTYREDAIQMLDAYLEELITRLCAIRSKANTN